MNKKAIRDASVIDLFCNKVIKSKRVKAQQLEMDLGEIEPNSGDASSTGFDNIEDEEEFLHEVHEAADGGLGDWKIDPVTVEINGVKYTAELEYGKTIEEGDMGYDVYGYVGTISDGKSTYKFDYSEGNDYFEVYNFQDIQ